MNFVQSGLLAAGIGEVMPFVVVAIMIVTWLVNLFKSNQNPPPPIQRGRPPRRGNERLQSEIDIFLQEVGGKQKPRPEEIPIEIVEEPRRRPVRSGAGQPGRRRQARPARPAPTAVKPRPKKRTALADRKGPGSADLGSNVREHLTQYMEEKHFDEHLGHDVQQSVAEHLGSIKQSTTTQAATVESKALSQATGNIVELLRDPDGVRQAILLSTILAPPKGLQGRR